MEFSKRILTVFVILSLFISCSTDEESPQEMMTTVEEEMASTDEMNIEDEPTGNDASDDKDENTDNSVEDDNNENSNLLASGTLQTSSDYPTAGNFEIIKDIEIITVELDASFSVEGGLPDLVIYLSNVTDSQENAILISDTAADSGMQSIEIPSEVDFLAYKYVLLYCREFNQKVGFGEIIQRSSN